MVQNKITGERFNVVSVEQNCSERQQSTAAAENMGGPLIDKVQGNPEFTKWWKRWASRVQRLSTRKNISGRRVKVERQDEVRHRNVDLQSGRGTSRDCEFKRYL